MFGNTARRPLGQACFLCGNQRLPRAEFGRTSEVREKTHFRDLV